MLARFAWCPDAPTTSRLSPVCSPFSRPCAALFHALPMDSGTLPSPGHGQSAWPRPSCSGLFALKAGSGAGAPCQRHIWSPCRHTWRATARVGSAVSVSDKIDPTLKGERPMTLAAVRMSLLDRSYDYVIVGAGSAGCVVARRLMDGTDATVLLLEAGGPGEGVASLSNPPQWVENLGSPYDWAYRYEPSPHVAGRSIPLPLGKVLGGSGSINAMVWVRGHRADYDGWAEAGNAGWGFGSVLPLFKKSEDWEDGASEFRGAGGPLRIERARNFHPAAAALIEACKSYGMPYLDDMNVPEPEGVGPVNENVRDGTRCSTWSAYMRPVVGHQNLTVLTRAQAVKLTLSGTRCTGLDFLRDGQLRSVRASREVVLCAGAIHTPRLLLLSGIGPQGDLEQLGIDTVIDLPGVGRNLQD